MKVKENEKVLAVNPKEKKHHVNNVLKNILQTENDENVNINGAAPPVYNYQSFENRRFFDFNNDLKPMCFERMTL